MLLQFRTDQTVMPRYSYRAVSSEGMLIRGELDARDLSALEASLAGMKLELVLARKHLLPGLPGRLQQVPLRERIHFFFHLEQLLQAGIPLMDALQELRLSAPDDRLAPILGRVLKSLESGSPLSDAMREHDNAFDAVSCALVRAGEHSGMLPQTLGEIGKMLKGEEELRSFLKKLAIYPCIVLTVSLCAVIVSLVFVVPELAKLFRATGAPLPSQTRALLWLSNLITHHWTGIAATLSLSGMASLFAIARFPAVGQTWAALKLKFPGIGPVYRKILLARFSTLLALLYASGIPVLRSLELTRGVLSNTQLANALEDARQQVAQGRNLSDAFSDANAFPSLIIRMLRLGEQTGALDLALRNAARFFESDVREAFARLQAWMEPALILLLGGLVLWIASAILSPIYDIITRMKI